MSEREIIDAILIKSRIYYEKILMANILYNTLTDMKVFAKKIAMQK